jgi:hypothetical protein
MFGSVKLNVTLTLGAAMLRLFGNFLTVSVFSILLSACDGGGGGSESASTPTQPTADTNLNWGEGNWDQQEWQ